MAKIDKAIRKSRVRPNGTTAKILLIGIALGALIWFFWARPAGTALTAAQEVRQEAESTSRVLEAEITSFRSGESFTSRELPDAIGPADTLLPSSETSSPGDVADVARDLALSQGFEITAISFQNRYTDAGNGKMRADIQMEIATPEGDARSVPDKLQAMSRWMDAVADSEQLVTITTTGPTADSESGAATMPVTITVWATNTPSLLDAGGGDAAATGN